MEELGGAIGTVLLPFVTKIVSGIATWAEKTSTANPAIVSRMGVAIAAAAAAIGPLVLVLGLTATAFGALNLSMLPVVAAVGAVGAAVGLATVVWVKWGDDIKLITQAVIRTVQPAWDEFAKSFVAAARWMAENVINPIWDMVKQVGGFLTDVLGGIIDGVIGLFEKLPVFMRPPLYDSFVAARDFVDNVKVEMESMRNEVPPIVEDTVDGDRDRRSKALPGTGLADRLRF